MKITFIAGRNFIITEAIKNYAESKLTGLKKYFDAITEIQVTLSAVKSKNGPIQTAEVRVYIDGDLIKAVAVESDLYASIDKVEHILEKQLTKYKEKLRDNNHVNPQTSPKYTKTINYNEEENFIKYEKTSRIIPVSIHPKPMDIEEAILQLETLNKDFYVFKNSETGKMEVVYKKRNGDYGYIRQD
ncbi:putative sigma-54 modulation protein [Cetobacterium ceti]|uniref:Ribosome hibernation promoting factor n=1 Tax=Cetobacterium ceti TaxID=180163 RepID=A0A1T4NFT7_9FUSO|nr:ribosome-associated translation inhibitor RaiA [Cetobacterium ceti]SJZ77648.1 putative sigma-54 modulation protein [Cetobacterium ceti]